VLKGKGVPGRRKGVNREGGSVKRRESEWRGIEVD